MFLIVEDALSFIFRLRSRGKASVYASSNYDFVGSVCNLAAISRDPRQTDGPVVLVIYNFGVLIQLMEESKRKKKNKKNKGKTTSAVEEAISTSGAQDEKRENAPESNHREPEKINSQSVPVSESEGDLEKLKLQQSKIVRILHFFIKICHSYRFFGMYIFRIQL